MDVSMLSASAAWRSMDAGESCLLCNTSNQCQGTCCLRGSMQYGSCAAWGTTSPSQLQGTSSQEAENFAAQHHQAYNTLQHAVSKCKQEQHG